MFESSVIHISRSALDTNLQFLRKCIGKDVRYCSVVKGNAYGHGLPQFAKMAMDLDVDYFGVYSADEAYRLLSSLDAKPDVFIMGMVDDEAVQWAVDNRVEMCMFDMQRLEVALEASLQSGKKAIVHIEVETGMNRTGFAIEQLHDLGIWLQRHTGNFLLKGICTHFSGAESMANDFRVQSQIVAFEKAKEIMKAQGLQFEYHHAACSAAMMNYPQTMGNMVRIGIMQYGFWPNQETFIRYAGVKDKQKKMIKRIIRWSSQIMSMKEVKKGNFVSYGTSFLAYRDMTIAMVPVGYSHGYSRNLSNHGKVLVKGTEANIIGIINMNALCIDVTGIKGLQKGDEVVLIGAQNKKTISVSSFSEMSQQLNYELLTRLPLDIPRTIVE